MIFGVNVENLIGLPTVRYVPRLLCATSTIVPLSRKAGSLASSFIVSTGAHGMSNLRRMSTASNLVLSASHFSISAKISKIWSDGRRAVL